MNIILGLCLIFLGVSVLFDPVSYHGGYQTYIDLTNVRIPFSVAAILIGGYCVYLGVKKIIENKSDYLICPDCQDTFNYSEVINKNQCPKCGVKVENLKGFYKRHTEFNKEIDSSSPNTDIK